MTHNSSLHILLVDDEIAHIEAIKRAIETSDLVDSEIHTVSSLGEFSAHVTNHKPDIALMDLNLPDGRALDVMQSPLVKDIFPVIIMTSFGNEQIVVESMKAGALDYIVKSPDTFFQMPHTIHRTLREWSLLQEHQQSLSLLLEREEELEVIYQNTPFIMMLLDRERKVRKTNDYTYMLTGRSALEKMDLRPGEVLRCVNSLDSPEGCGYGSLCRECMIRKTVMDTLQENRGYQQVEAQLLCKVAGEPQNITFLLSTTPLNIMKQSMVLVTMLDITQRKQVEEALKTSEEKNRMVARLSSDFAYSCFHTGTSGYEVDWITDAFYNLTGYTEGELRDKGCWMFVAHPEDSPYALEPLFRLQPGETDTRVFRIVTKSGEILTVINHLECVEDVKAMGRKRIYGAVQNISERIRAEEALNESEIRLLHSQKMEAIGRLAGGVAHDFNNLLTVMMGYTEVALKRLKPEDPFHADMLEVYTAGRRAADLTKQLLAFSRKQIAIPQVLDLNEQISNTLKMLHRMVEEDIDLVFNPGNDLWKVYMDPSQMEQVLTNLTVNARDAIKGTGTITIETMNSVLQDTSVSRVENNKPGDYVLLTIRDNGIGMDPATVEQIFEPFFTTKEEGKGTGLGLATVYGIVRQNNGFINVSSDLGKGSTFKIYLPRTDEEKTELIPSLAKEVLTGKETILIVEDEETILKLAKTILERYGYRVLTSRTPGEALLLCEQSNRPIDLLLSDVVMPVMSGKDLAERIRKLNPGIRTLYMSGYTADIIAHHGILGIGINFLQKTVHR